VNTSLLYEELAPLNAQIEATEGRLKALEADLHVIDAELETHLALKQRFEALSDVCDALDRLDELDAGKLFWDELTEIADTAVRLELLRNRIARFDDSDAELQMYSNPMLVSPWMPTVAPEPDSALASAYRSRIRFPLSCSCTCAVTLPPPPP